METFHDITIKPMGPHKWEWTLERADVHDIKTTVAEGNTYYATPDAAFDAAHAALAEALS